MEEPPHEAVHIMERNKEFLLFDPFVPNWKKVSPTVALLLLLAREGEKGAHALDTCEGCSSHTLQDLITSALSSFKHKSEDQRVERVQNIQERHHPLDVELNLTPTCSGKCIYCYYTYTCDTVLTSSQWKSIIASAAEMHPDRIIFSGGDPVKYEGFCDIAHYARELSLSTHLLSNGLIPEDIIPDISAGFNSIQISIDGFERTQQTLRGISFHNVMTSIERLVDEGMPVTAGITLTALNIDEVLPLIEYLSQKGVNAFHISLLKEIGNAQNYNTLRAAPDAIVALFKKLFELDDTIDTLYHLLPRKLRKKFNCGAGTEILSIMPDGEVYPCDALINPKFSCGSALEKELNDIYLNSSILHTLRNLTVEQLPPCDTCIYRYVCGGGCIGEAVAQWDRVGIFQRDCEFLKKFYEEFMWIT